MKVVNKTRYSDTEMFHLANDYADLVRMEGGVVVADLKIEDYGTYFLATHR